jgi:hypothetical protein
MPARRHQSAWRWQRGSRIAVPAGIGLTLVLAIGIVLTSSGGNTAKVQQTALGTPTSTSSGVLWEGLAATEGTKAFVGLETAPGTISVVSDPTYGDVYQYQTHYNNGVKERAESRGTTGLTFNNSQLGKTFYVGWRAKWNVNITPGAWTSLMQFHDDGAKGISQDMTIKTLGNGELSMQQVGADPARPGGIIWNTPWTNDEWHTFVIAFNFERDDTGWVELWYDGVQQTFVNGSTLYHGPLLQSIAPLAYLKWGVYRSGGNKDQADGNQTEWVDDPKVGTTYAAVAPAATVQQPAPGTTTSAYAASPVAPIGAGPWTTVNFGEHVQECEGGTITGTTFTLPDTPDGIPGGGACGNHATRAEWQLDGYPTGGNHYTSGTDQFAGTFTINSMNGTGICLKQTFSTGPYFMLAVTGTGNLYVVGRKTVAVGLAKVGVPVTINTIHNTMTHTFELYINGQLVWTDPNAPHGPWYDKVGAYKTGSGHGSISVTWRNISVWYQA